MLTAVISGWQDLGKCLLLFHMLLICVNFFMTSMKCFHIQSKRVIFNLKEIKCAHEDIRVCSVAQLCPTLCWPYGLACNPLGSSVHGIFPGKNTGVSSYSRGSSKSRDWTHASCVSCLVGRLFTTERPTYHIHLKINM